jgi:hypothetical protein
MRNKFFDFLDSLESNDNKSLIESIKAGYNVINESILMTPLPMARLTGMADTPPSEPIAKNGWSTKQNSDNEYFDQTLPDDVLSITDKSYTGSRIGTYPTTGKSHIRPDGDKHLSGNWGDSSGGEYAGSSGGYSLGGPSTAG